MSNTSGLSCISLVIIFSLLFLMSGCSDDSTTSDSDPIILNLVDVSGGIFEMYKIYEEGGETIIDTFNVELNSFLISETEVTQYQYEAVMVDSIPIYYYGSGDNYPAYNVSWLEAICFCNQLSIDNNYNPCYSGSYVDSLGTIIVLPPDSLFHADSVYCDFSVNGYRLPTEAEWEYASRNAGVSSYILYSGSENIENVAWYISNSGNSAHPVKEKQPNELGLYDMSGNVWEWCWDWYEEYSGEDQINPTGPPDQGYIHSLRGGAWYSPEVKCSSSFRAVNQPQRGSNYNGFRVARNAD